MKGFVRFWVFGAKVFNFLKLLMQIYQNQEEKVEFSGPLLTQSHQIDELLEQHERQVRQAVRRSWFQKGRKSIFGKAVGKLVVD